jgi:lipid II:glycine glycyltransferase (peptidoglycan interpeptide bridge formation enzyme)
MFLTEDCKEAEPAAALAAAREIVQNHCHALELRPWPLGVNADFPLPGRRAVGEISVIDLSEGAEAALARMDGKARRMAGQAERRGVACARAEGGTAVDEYYEILQASARRWGMNQPTIPKGLLQSIVRHGGSDVEIWFARYEGKPIAGGVVLFGSDEMIFWSAAMHSEFSALRPSNALNVALIKHASSRGLRWYNLCSSSGLSGVERFKDTLGAKHVPCTTISTERRLYAAYRILRKVLIRR